MLLTGAFIKRPQLSRFGPREEREVIVIRDGPESAAPATVQWAKWERFDMEIGAPAEAGF